MITSGRDRASNFSTPQMNRLNVAVIDRTKLFNTSLHFFCLNKYYIFYFTSGCMYVCISIYKRLSLRKYLQCSNDEQISIHH